MKPPDPSPDLLSHRFRRNLTMGTGPLQIFCRKFKREDRSQINTGRTGVTAGMTLCLSSCFRKKAERRGFSPGNLTDSTGAGDKYLSRSDRLSDSDESPTILNFWWDLYDWKGVRVMNIKLHCVHFNVRNKMITFTHKHLTAVRQARYALVKWRSVFMPLKGGSWLPPLLSLRRVNSALKSAYPETVSKEEWRRLWVPVKSSTHSFATHRFVASNQARVQAQN